MERAFHNRSDGPLPRRAGGAVVVLVGVSKMAVAGVQRLMKDAPPCSCPIEWLNRFVEESGALAASYLRPACGNAI